MENIDYLQYGFTRDALLKKIASQMSQKRFTHVLGVEKAALTLAKKNNCDLTKASLAALTHDYAKERSDADFLAMIDKKKLDPDLKNWNNNIWHGMVGQYFVAEELGIEDPEILKAIAVHTTGDQKMSTLAKVLYVADYIEENRHFPGVEKARQVAAENLDAAVAFETQHTLLYLMENKKSIYPLALATYNAYVAKP